MKGITGTLHEDRYTLVIIYIAHIFLEWEMFHIFFFNFVLWPTNAQLFHKLSQSYMFRHYRVILRELVINTLPSYTSISNAAVANTVYNKDVSHRFYATCTKSMWNIFIVNCITNSSVKHLYCKLHYQQLHSKCLCNLARYWLQAPWGWHDSVETCRIVIICEIIVHLLVIVQNNKRYTIQGIKIIFRRKL